MFWSKRKGSDFRAEIDAHLQQEAGRLREQGLSEGEARAAARRAFGNLTHAQEKFYERSHWMAWDHLTLALGIGANAAIFSLINAVAGADRRTILWLAARLGLVLTLAGVVIGLAVAAGLTTYLQSLLYEVRPTDPGTFAGIALLLASVATVGCYIPARRAMRVDPMVALRHE